MATVLLPTFAGDEFRIWPPITNLSAFRELIRRTWLNLCVGRTFSDAGSIAS